MILHGYLKLKVTRRRFRMTTMPKGWDLSEMATERSLPVEAIEEIINFDMDARMAFEDDMA